VKRINKKSLAEELNLKRMEESLSPDCVDDWEAELALGQVLGEALVVRVLLQAEIGEVVANL
jgi:hypothetical protein